MSDKMAQSTIESTKPPDRRSGNDAAAESPSLARRIFGRRNVLSVFLTLVVLCLAYRELSGLDWRQVLANVRAANMGLFALAFALFYCSFPLRAARWRALLANVGYHDPKTDSVLPSVFGLSRIMYVAWFVNCVAVARLGDAYRGYLLKRASGVSFVVTLGTVLAERFLDLVVLAAMVGTSALVVFHGSLLPAEVSRAFAFGLVLSLVGIVGLLSMRRLRGAAERVLPKRLRTHYASLEHGLVGSFRGRLPLLVAYSALGWALEGATLYVTAAAVGTPISVAGALAVALIASILTTMPFTPGGLGFTEAGMVVMLGWLGLDAQAAGAVTALFRLINYWSIVVLGFVLYVASRRTYKNP